MRITSPILVTGMHNSGTTWLGKMISQAPELFYVHELFNLNRNPGERNVVFPYWFMYITTENESGYLTPLSDALKLKYNLSAGLRSSESLKDILFHLIRYLACLGARINQKRLLLKDPIAIFSAEWLNLRFDLFPVVILRHPCAVASSLKKRDWRHPFSHFLQQPLLMRDHLTSYEDPIRYFATHEVGIVDQAALLWNVIYHVILSYRKKHGDWLYVRHEDLSRAPVQEFKKIYEFFDLSFTKKVERTINEHCFADVGGSDRQVIGLRRDSKATIDTWKHALTDQEIMKVREQTWDTARHFYPEGDW